MAKEKRSQTERYEKSYALTHKALVKTGLNSTQIDNVIDPIVKDTIKFFRTNLPKENSPFWDFNKKTTEAAQYLDMPQIDYIEKIASKKVQLFYDTPEPVLHNITETPELINIDRDLYINMVSRQPQLLTRDPKTLARHADLMREFNRRGIITPNVEELYKRKPSFLCLSDDNFQLRLKFAEIAEIEHQKNFGLLSRTRKQMEYDLIEHLGYNPDETVIQAKALSRERRTLLAGMVADKRLKHYRLQGQDASLG